MKNDQGLRMTSQRQVILEELRKVKSHPTADQVFEMVRKRLPRISLATVYRNLDILSNAQAIQKLELGGTQRRYDGDTSVHYHARCLSCDCVVDVPMEAFDIPEIAWKEGQDFKVMGHSVELVGLCRECRDLESRKVTEH